MIVNEIVVDKQSLNGAIHALVRLKPPTLFYTADPDDLLMNTSISDTSDEVRELFRTLQQTEGAFLNLLSNTIDALEVAGVSFEEADKAAAHLFESLPFTLLL